MVAASSAERTTPPQRERLALPSRFRAELATDLAIRHFERTSILGLEPGESLKVRC